jgi:hypothetical protein
MAVDEVSRFKGPSLLSATYFPVILSLQVYKMDNQADGEGPDFLSAVHHCPHSRASPCPTANAHFEFRKWTKFVGRRGSHEKEYDEIHVRYAGDLCLSWSIKLPPSLLLSTVVRRKKIQTVVFRFSGYLLAILLNMRPKRSPRLRPSKSKLPPLSLCLT